MVRVDTRNLPLRLLVLLYGWGLGLAMYALIAAVRATSRIETEGAERVPTPCILAMWHSNNLPCFVADVFRRTGGRYVMINHPGWSMKPVHVILRCLGVRRLFLGSTGNDGRQAADRVAQALREGCSTFINPDGPAGPPRRPHKGVAHVSLQTGVAVVPVRIEASRELVLRRTWDGKRLVLPFGRVRIVYGAPIHVAREGFDESLAEIARALDDPRKAVV